MSRQKQESKQLTRTAEAVTGQWFCSAGNHFTTAAAVRRRNRRVCITCSERMAAVRRSHTKQG